MMPYEWWGKYAHVKSCIYHQGVSTNYTIPTHSVLLAFSSLLLSAPVHGSWCKWSARFATWLSAVTCSGSSPPATPNPMTSALIRGLPWSLRNSMCCHRLPQAMQVLSLFKRLSRRLWRLSGERGGMKWDQAYDTSALEEKCAKEQGHFEFWMQLWTMISKYIKMIQNDIYFYEESNAASTMRHETKPWQFTLLYAFDHKPNMEICSGSGSCLSISTALSSVNHPTVWAKLVSLPWASKSTHSRLAKNLPEAWGTKDTI